MKLFRFFEYAYVAAALFFIYEGIMTWGTDRTKAYIFLLFGGIAVFMFFFKRRFRRKFEERNKQE